MSYQRVKMLEATEKTSPTHTNTQDQATAAAAAATSLSSIALANQMAKMVANSSIVVLRI